MVLPLTNFSSLAWDQAKAGLKGIRNLQSDKQTLNTRVAGINLLSIRSLGKYLTDFVRTFLTPKVLHLSTRVCMLDHWHRGGSSECLIGASEHVKVLA